MPVSDLGDWLSAYGKHDFTWYIKRLSANDTLANGSNQAGPYIPREVLFKFLPALNRPQDCNPDFWFNLYIDSHADRREVRAVWYNSKLHGKTENGRNEARLTNFGGAASALLDPESTGALAVFAFGAKDDGSPVECHVWVCCNETEEELVEERVGPIEPGKGQLWPQRQHDLFSPGKMARTSCWLDITEIPASWLVRFPTGAEIVRKAVEMQSDAALDPDKRLLLRRACEFDIFRSVEQAIELPHISAGFTSIEDFISRAQTVLQRRKARSGRSLELHVREIFIEERLVENVHFSHQPVSEAGKAPDFLFPSATAYHNHSFPADRLRMLAVKTTCRDRWRQILNEADRVRAKHLFTLQEGVSQTQFAEMKNAGVQLVVPRSLKEKFPKSVQPHLLTLQDFITSVQKLGTGG